MDTPNQWLLIGYISITEITLTDMKRDDAGLTPPSAVETPVRMP